MLLDLAVICCVAIVLRFITFDLDLFERLHEYSRQHEDAEIDELLVSLVIAALGFIVFGVRRIRDQRRELALRLAAEEHALMLSRQDPLTGLPNRRRFQEVLSETLEGEAKLSALFLLDLDGFKQINDVFGHAAGDEALVTIAQRLHTIDEALVLCARLGGDEFALIAHAIADPGDAESIARRVIDLVDDPIVTAGLELSLDVSIGIAVMEDRSVLPEEYLRRADVALYRAKIEPGSSFLRYGSGMDTDLDERIRLESDLRHALRTKQIVPHYQPIVNLKTGEILKFEALARWSHPTRGNIPPSVFIPLAEARGLIAELTETILRQALNDAAAWPPSVMVSVNLSPLLLRSKSFGLRLAAILSESRFPPSRLEFEITERAVEVHPDELRPCLDNLRALGIRTAIDDFGTGYSSLARLKSLHFDDLKIAQSFIQNIADTDDRMLFVQTMIRLGRGLGMSVTAEGIEEPGQREALLAEGCTQGQGFLFSAAVPAERVHLLLARQKKKVAV